MLSHSPEMIEKASQFDDNPEGWQHRWTVEMDSSDRELSNWHKRGDKVIRRYVDEREASPGAGSTSEEKRLNLFSANIQTTRALLYAQQPKVGVERRFSDPSDDPARVAGEILQRLLNTDIERDSDTYTSALFHALDDWLLPGLGNIRLRYEATFKTLTPDKEQAEPQEMEDPHDLEEAAGTEDPEEEKTGENIDYDYAHWRDQRWSPCRHFGEVRWWAFKADMTRDALRKRFKGALTDAEIDAIPLDAKEKNSERWDAQTNNPWSRAEVWEIWSKDTREVFWWVRGAAKILDRRPDPYGLDGFFPFPEPLFANLTTSKLVPVPDFTLAQDQYDEIDEVSTRITLLEKALVVRGVYDKTANEVQNLLSATRTNDMIPIENFAMFAEKGGLKGSVDWFPVEMVVNVMDKLREYRTELIALSYQVTGMSDIMRGQSSGTTTATEQSIKAKFAGVRMQSKQQEFARFASDLQKLKAEMIAKHYDAATIIKGANTQYMLGVDASNIMAAVQMIKDDVYQYRVEVKPDAISMADYTAVKQERSEMLTAVGTFLQSSLPVMQALPQLAPALLQMLQWALAGFKGEATIEGVIDQAISKIQRDMAQPKPPPPPPPEVQKAQMDMQIAQQTHQMDMQKSMVELQATVAKHKMDLQKMQIDMQGKLAAHQIDAHKMALEAQTAEHTAALDAASREAEHTASMAKIDAEARADAMKTVNDVTRSNLQVDAAKKAAASAGKEKKDG